jgi:hypothetical protein
MKVNKTHISIKSGFPLMGLNTYAPSTLIDGGLSPHAINMLATKGTVVTRRGHRQLGSAIVDVEQQEITDPVLALFEFEDLNDTRSLIAITTKRQYKYDSGDEEWDDITVLGTSYTIDDSDATANTITISGDGDLSTTFPIGSTIKITGTANINGSYTVVDISYSAPDFVIELDDVTHGSQTGTVNKYIEWTGDEDDFVDWVLGTDGTGRRAFVTNGKDTPITWNGSGHFTLFEPNYTDFVTCKTFEVFFDTLVMGNITTTSREPQLIAWSDIADFDEFEAGTAGFNLVADSQGSISRLLKLGDRLAIYSENSIGVVTNVGGTAIFSFEQLIQSTRLLSPRAIVSLGPYHLYASQENFYLFDGTRMVRPIGDAVHKTYREEVFLSLANRSYAFADIAKNTVFWVIPVSATENVVYTSEYNIYVIDQIAWSRSTYSTKPTVVGFFSRDIDLTWDSSQLAGLSWLDVAGSWLTGSFRADFPVRVIGSEGRVYLDDESQRSDDGTDIPFVWDSKDHVLPEIYQSQNGRWSEIELELRGTEVEIWYSLDQGSTYQLLKTLTLSSRWNMYKVFIDKTSRTMRFSLRNEGESDWCEMRFYNVWVRPTSPK